MMASRASSLAPGINQTKQRVESHSGGLLKRHTIVLTWVARSLTATPDKVGGVQVVLDVHAQILIYVFTLSIHLSKIV